MLLSNRYFIKNSLREHINFGIKIFVLAFGIHFFCVPGIGPRTFSLSCIPSPFWVLIIYLPLKQPLPSWSWIWAQAPVSAFQGVLCRHMPPRSHFVMWHSELFMAVISLILLCRATVSEDTLHICVSRAAFYLTLTGIGRFKWNLTALSCYIIGCRVNHQNYNSLN